MHKSYAYNLETFEKKESYVYAHKKEESYVYNLLVLPRLKEHAILTQCHGLVSQI